jgi:phage gpG-like protein
MDIEGLGAVTRAIGKLEQLAKTPGAILTDIGLVVERAIRRAFSASQAPEIVATVTDGKAEEAAGAPWAPLAESTIRRRRNRDKGSIRILRDTTTMQRSISHIVTGGAVRVGTGVEYGKWHQGGTKRMPARPFVGYDEEDEQTFFRVAIRHLEAVTR